MFKNKIVSALTGILCASAVMFFTADNVEAKKIEVPGKIIFIPHDNRPVSDEQTADTIRQLGYEVVVPPDELLGGRTEMGDPDKLWDWLENETGIKKNSERKQNVRAVVISGDSMVYGSLVASRKHQIPVSVLQERVNRFADYHNLHPELKTYVFSSVMRTPRSGEASGSEEPAYYQDYGSDIFRYTSLVDKKEVEGLDKREEKELKFLTKLIPETHLQDWLARRNKNFSVNKAMIDLTRMNNFTYFALGRDDNAPYSQTHRESRKLSSYGVNSNLNLDRFQNMSGIDEFGLLLLTRAVNDIKNTTPLVYVKYNRGIGARTVPSYSDETIETTVRSHIKCAGGLLVNSPDKADFVLMVNTKPDGSTSEANWKDNDGKADFSTRYFSDLVQEAVKAGQPVGVADIAYANGADNALMEELNRRNLLFKLKAYSGWNTPTNSTGFVLGQGMLVPFMTEEAKNHLLLIRYLDDWAYQSNVRQTMARQLGWFKGSGLYSSLDSKRINMQYRTANLLSLFAKDNLPPYQELSDIKVEYPWNRMFECRIQTRY